MIAVILCGGIGSRISKFTQKTPKPLLKIEGKKVFLDYLLKNISRFKLNKIILLCCYKKYLFFKKYHKKKINNVEIVCIDEKEARGTGGALNNIKRFKSDFFLFNGDTYFDINYLELKRIITESPKRYLANIALANVEGSRYLNLSLHKNKEVFFKKNSSIINGGIYYFKKSIFSHLTKKFISLENDILPKLIKKKLLLGTKFLSKKNYFIDIGTYADFNKSKTFVPLLDKKKAVFLDRDGVLNYDFSYVHKKSQFVWKKNVIKAIKILNDNNFYVFVVTNQSGIGRGYYNENDVEKLHKWINKILISNYAHIDDFFYAPFFKKSKIKKYRKNFNLRKPNIGMFKVAMNKWNFDNYSYMIGDQKSDIEFAKNSNLRGFLVKDDLLKIVKRIIKNK
jgi:D,D-heptose 1,7-bisphosphate phosphatase